jgi:hypothetical protein
MKLRLSGNSYLCDQNKVFYINIPKCVSTAFTHLFFKNQNIKKDFKAFNYPDEL